ncbi:unnamed protein product [Calicophoron daubneyi]|uniref:protein-histidine N-methyltransferase n=1 Tax=Calicophoron daubneyi TaxID=300641 RepID=A0AAV2TEY1_CALDB
MALQTARKETYKFQFCFGSDNVHELPDQETDIYKTDVEVYSLADANEASLSLPTCSYRPDGLDIKYVSEKALDAYLRELAKKPDQKCGDTALMKAIHAKSDVSPGVIEGGFTIWDGSRYLIEHLLAKYPPDFFRSNSVLELGCGCGLPGLVAMKLGASTVTFQDYNPDVLTFWTIPNVKLNSTPVDGFVVNFYSGDWLHLAEKWAGSNCPKYDIVLASETVYRPDLYVRFHRILEVALEPRGTVYLLSKSSYGSGGTIYDFLEFVSSHSMFAYDVEEVKAKGCVRCLVRLTWKH